MCSPIAMGVVSGVQAGLGAIGAAQAASAENKRRKQDYEYKLAIRKNRWMRELSIFGTKKVQYEKDLNEANIAAQRAYTQSQISLNRAQSQALIDQQEDIKNMLKAEGMLEVGAAERGVRGKSIARVLDANLGSMGLANAMRVRALTESKERMAEHNESVARKNRSLQNKLYSKVAIQPTPDLPPPPPVMQDTSFGLFTGLIGAGIQGFNTYGEFKTNKVFD